MTPVYSSLLFHIHFVIILLTMLHDDMGHLGMGRTLGLVQERFFGLVCARASATTSVLVTDVLNSSKHLKKLKCIP